MTKPQQVFNNLRCPCGRGVAGKPLLFDKCCGQYLDYFDTNPAPDPESLMRSRYSAFVLERDQYLLDTWSPTTRPPSIEFDPQAKWLGLEIKSKRMVDLTQAYVEFVARYRINGQATRLHENSFFVQAQNRWMYVNAQDQ